MRMKETNLQIKHLVCARRSINAYVQELPEGGYSKQGGLPGGEDSTGLKLALEVDGFRGYAGEAWPLQLPEEMWE